MVDYKMQRPLACGGSTGTRHGSVGTTCGKRTMNLRAGWLPGLGRTLYQHSYLVRINLPSFVRRSRYKCLRVECRPRAQRPSNCSVFHSIGPAAFGSVEAADLTSRLRCDRSLLLADCIVEGRAAYL